ncbi:MAG: hypothetical protein NTV01_06890 [Bacteroidia bacterium]|nr:hypothetical protein [Bacteroidia bacterium]
MTRSFSGNDNGYELARDPDKVYYPYPEIRLESWANQYKIGENQFELTYRSKNPGIFPEVPGYCFAIRNELWYLDDKVLNARVTSFRLVLDLQGKFGPAFSRIPIVPLPEQIVPSKWEKRFDLYPDTGNFEAKYKIDPKMVKYCELDCVFRYQDFQGTWVDRSVTIQLQKNLQIIEDEVSLFLYPDKFFNKIAANIRPINDTIRRRFKSLDLIFLAGDQYFKNYYETYINTGNADAPPMGNISNGYGLFTMVRSTKIENMTMSFYTLDSLASGQYTRKLGFRRW